MNLYRYVSNSPLQRLDPFGLVSEQDKVGDEVPIKLGARIQGKLQIDASEEGVPSLAPGSEGIRIGALFELTVPAEWANEKCGDGKGSKMWVSFAYDSRRQGRPPLDEHGKLYDNQWGFDFNPVQAKAGTPPRKGADGKPELLSATKTWRDYPNESNGRGTWIWETNLAIGIVCQCDADHNLFLNNWLDGDSVSIHMQRVQVNDEKKTTYVEAIPSSRFDGVPPLDTKSDKWIKLMNTALGTSAEGRGDRF